MGSSAVDLQGPSKQPERRLELADPRGIANAMEVPRAARNERTLALEKLDDAQPVPKPVRETPLQGHPRRKAARKGLTITRAHGVRSGRGPR